MRLRVAALLLPLLVIAGRATADDWKFDPKKAKPVHKVGDKSFQESEQFTKKNEKVSSGDTVLKADKSEETISARSVSEVLAVDGTKVTDEKIKYEKWKIEKKGEQADTSLEGHTVHVKGTGKDRTAVIEDNADQVSDQAKEWVQTEHVKKKNKKKDEPKDKGEESDEGLAGLKLFLPDGPIGDNAEWKPDVKKIAEDMGLPIDAEKSTASGKLTKLRVENGVHVGLIEVKISLAFAPPGLTWTEGGVMEIALTIDTSLELEKRDAGSANMEIKLVGKGDAQTPQGVLNLKTNSTFKNSVKAGPVEK